MNKVVCINKNFDDILGFKLPSGWEFSNKIYSKPHVTIGKIYDVYEITNNYSQNLLLRGQNFYIMDDNGNEIYPNKENFITIEEYRDIKLNKLLK